MNTIRIYFLLLFGMIGIGLSAQVPDEAYVQLEDASGYTTEIPLESLEVASQDLIDLLPEDYQDQFRVYDFGYYLHQQSTTGGFRETLQKKIEEIEEMTPYYLLFGKQTDASGVYTDVTIDFKFGNFPTCKEFDETVELSLLQSVFDEYFNDNINNTYSAEVGAIEFLTQRIGVAQFCCLPDEDAKRTAIQKSIVFECPVDLVQIETDIFITGSSGEGYYFTTAGTVVFLEDITNPTFFVGNEDKLQPRGALHSFRKNNEVFRATFIGNTFSGYNRIIDGSLGDLYKFDESNSVVVGEEIIVKVGLTAFNSTDCNTSVYNFKYEIPDNYSDDDLNGVVGEDKIAQLPISFEKEILVQEQIVSGLDAYSSTPIININSYIGSSIVFESIDHGTEIRIPCPNIQVTELDIVNFQGGYMLAQNDGSIFHKTENGWYYWYYHENQFYLFAYFPQFDKYIPVRVTEDAWTQPGEVAEALILELLELLQEPHVFLAIIGASDVPVISQIADLADGVIYLSEGAIGDGLLSMASTIPGGIILKGAGAASGFYISLKGLKSYVKGSGKITDLKVQQEVVENYVQGLRLDQIQATKLKSVFEESPGLFGEALENRYVIGAWKLFDDANIPLNLSPELDDLTKLFRLGDDLKANPNLYAYLSTNSGGVKAWDVCFIDDVVRTNPDKLTKVSRYLDNNPNAEAVFKTEFNSTSLTRRGDFVDRTSWADDLKKAHDPDGNFSNFSPQGLNTSDVPQSVLDDMLAEASAPQFVPDYVKSGNSVPARVPVSEGYTLYKVVAKGGDEISDFSVYWLKLDDLNLHKNSVGFEQKLGLPASSHGAKYDVFKIELKSGETANVFESTIANTVEGGFSTTGGATQSLVLNRGKWKDPELVPSLEIFPPAN